MMGNPFNCQELSKTRSVIMGLAILWIMLFHNWHVCTFIPYIGYISGIGFWGVELFLFISGFGIVHSLQKNSTKQYFKNRIIRIVPVVLLIEIFRFIIEKSTTWNILPNSFVIYVGGIEMWYVKALVVYYLLAPYLYKQIEKYGIIVFWITTLLFLISLPAPKGWLMPTRTIARLPVFVLGMCFAMNKLKVSKISLSIGIGILIIAWYLQINSYLNLMKDSQICSFVILFAIPTLISIFILLAKFLQQIHLNNIFVWLGNISLELYLIHYTIYIIIEKFTKNNTERFFIEFPVAIIIAYIAHKMAEPLQAQLRKYLPTDGR